MQVCHQSDTFVSIERYYSEHSLDPKKFETQWVDFFRTAPDLFELQRGLNNCFAYDIVPSKPILEEALLASRRLNDFPTSVRILAGLRDKVENATQYQQYLESLKEIREKLSIPTPEELGV